MPSKLDQLQQQFRQRIDQRKEENLTSIRLYNENQQRVLERVSKSQLPSMSEPSNSNNKPTLGRRNGSGVDRSRPLKPLAGRPPLHASQSTESAMVVGASSSKVRSSTAGTRPPVTQTKVQVQSTGTSNTRILSKSNHAAAKEAALADPKVASVTTTTTTFRMEKRNGTISRNGASSGTRSAPSLLKSAHTSTTVKTMERKLPQTSNCSPKNPPVSTTSRVSSVTTRAVSAVASKPTLSLPKTSRTVSKVAPTPKKSAPLDPNLTFCKICERSFANDRIEKHIQICEKTTNKKRKVYDASKIRVRGTEAEQFVRKGLSKQDPKPKKSNWRYQHETFISTIRQAKEVQRHLEAGGKLSDLPPPPPSENPDYIPCPHCGRKFNPAVADRHIPKCKNILSNKKPVPKKK